MVQVRSDISGEKRHVVEGCGKGLRFTDRHTGTKFVSVEIFIPPYCMRRRYIMSNHLRLRFPMPQLDIGNLAPGEPAIVQSPQEVAPQDVAPQQVQSVGTETKLSFETGGASDKAISSQSTRIDTGSTTALESTAAFESASARIATVPTSVPADSSVTEVSSSTVSLFAVSTSMILSPIASTSSRSSSSPVALAISASSSDSTMSASSSLALSSSSPSSSTSPATTSADPSKVMTHNAPFYAAIILGVLILIACVATIVACLIRIRTRRRDAAEISTIGWDPVVVDSAKEHTPSDFSLSGDRDVGEPKRSDSFVTARESYRPSFDATYPNPFLDPNPFVETAYYSPHQVPPLADSSAYPLPPRPPLTIPLPNGPYPTVRPLPAHLANRDPHRGSISTTNFGRSAASSRSGSVRSHLPSATTLCVTNGSASRASTALGMHDDLSQDQRYDHPREHDGPPQHAADFDFGAPLAQSVQEYGTPRERGARPRFMSLGSGRGLDVPWRRESFAVRGGGAPGWAPLTNADHTGQAHRDEGQGEGWTQTIRASVLGAFHAVTGVGSPAALSREEAREEGDDGLTRRPSMARERRELGWRRFEERERDLERQQSVSSRRSSLRAMHIPERSIDHPQLNSAISMATTAMTNTSVRTDNSRVPLIARPRPAALVSRASSVYSTVSAAPTG
ncbi:hypothetical protein B0H19DRAFT_1152961 [Mycena capillaripes]|nr:hypothetical protein B0H19DRAFT_1152961 [Mycena capillaripes]